MNRISDKQLAESLPLEFLAEFQESQANELTSVQVKINGKLVGDVINDNAHIPDNYRYHDVFHFTFATILDWSPCTRSMLKRKRKSDPILDEIEDGARATITEEAISLIIFNSAKRNNFFKENNISKSLIKLVMQMTDTFEVRDRSAEEWNQAILLAYTLFNKLSQNKGGKIIFNRALKSAQFSAS